MSTFEEQLEKGQEEINKNEVFKKIDELKLGATEKYKKNKGVIGDVFFLIASSIVILVILGLMELIDAKFDWSRYTTAYFWVDYFITQLATWSLRIMVKGVANRKEFRSNSTYLTLQSEMQTLVDEDSKNPFIEEEANVDDALRKVNAFKNKLKGKIVKYANKYKITNIIPYVKYIENIQNDEEVIKFEFQSDITYVNERKRKRWIKKQYKLNNELNSILIKLSPQWIEQNIDNQKVNYNKVSFTILVNGFTSTKHSTNNENYKTNSTSEFMKLTLPFFFVISIAMFILLPLTASELTKDVGAWAKLIVKFGIVGFSGVMMWINNPELFNKTENKALSQRVNRIKIYKKNKKD